MSTPGRARATDPNTSHWAAESIDVTQLQFRVLEVIRKYGEAGCIADDVVAQLPTLRMHTVIPRFAPLLDMGLIEDTGESRLGGAMRYQRVIRAVPRERVAEVRREHNEAAIRTLQQKIWKLTKELNNRMGHR